MVRDISRVVRGLSQRTLVHVRSAHNVPRIGRILMARGRDVTDVAMVTSFGPCTLADFKVFTDEVAEPALTAWRPSDHPAQL